MTATLPVATERLPFPELKRFSLEELEIACIDAFMSGRVYHAGGEKDLPGEAHRKMMYRAIQAVRRYRRDHRRNRSYESSTRVPPRVTPRAALERYELTPAGRAAIDPMEGA